MKRTHVAILRGGPSHEYDVSLRSGQGVLEALRETDYVTHDIIITRQGEWLVGGMVRKPEQALAAIDVVFNALHGSYGEDGTIQRLLDRLGLPYTGSKAYPSAIAMNKGLAKDHLRSHNIKLAPHMTLTRDGVADTRKLSHNIGHLFGPHYIVKPLRGGSSVGTQVSFNTNELARALEKAFAEHDEVIVEQRIEGREATIGVLEGYRGTELYELPVIEIVPPQDSHFSYEAKYNGQTEEICPGRFSDAEKKEIVTIGTTAHRALGLRHYSRTDVIVAADGIYFLEVNTLPGLTPTSLFPQAMGAIGGSYQELVTHLIDRAYHSHDYTQHGRW